MRVTSSSQSQVYYLFSDHLGSLNQTVDPNGALHAGRRYYPFGAPRATSPGSLETALTFTGQREQAEIGLFYYQSRWYDGQLGRFTSADTIIPEPGSPMAWDRYAYANNSPILYNDPTGHCAGPFLFACIVVANFIVDNAAVITAMAATAAITLPWISADKPSAEGLKTPTNPDEILEHVGASLAIYDVGKGVISFGNMVAGSPNPSIPGEELSNYAGGKATQKEYGEDSTLYRVHSKDRETGHYWMEDEPKSEVQWRMDQAVRPEWNTAEKISTMTIPKGASLQGWSGQAAYQGDFYIGGGNQVYLPYVPSEWISTSK